MKRFTIALAVVLALALSSTTLAKGPAKHRGGPRGGHQQVNRHHGNHGHQAHRPPVIRVQRPPVIRVQRPPIIRVYTPPVRVYYPPVYNYGYQSPEARLATGIGQIVAAAIDMGR